MQFDRLGAEVGNKSHPFSEVKKWRAGYCDRTHAGAQNFFAIDIPSPFRSIGIIELGKKLEIIYGAQGFRGKILSRKELAAVGELLPVPLSLWLSSAPRIVDGKG